MQQKQTIFILLAALTLTMACTIFVGGPAAPDPAVPVSTEAVGSLKDQIQTAVAEGAQSGLVTLRISETQLTSYLYYKAQSDPNALLTDPQVYLRDGQMKIYGKYNSGTLQANVNIVLAVGLDPEGKPQLQVVAADFGPIPAPSGINKAIAAVIEEAYTGSLGPVATGFRLESITIADGVMTVTGRIR